MTDLTSDISYIICSILAFIPAIVLHEVGHGFAAYKLGDPTAKSAGRLTLNPLAHIDPFGTVLMPLLLMLMNMPVFGDAQPVPYNPMYFKNKRLGDFIVGMAGPFMNLVQAIVGTIIMWVMTAAFTQDGYITSELVTGNVVVHEIFLTLVPLYVLYNLYFMVFNLIPVPPLDGSSIIALFVPERHLATYYRIQQYALPIFMIIVIVVPYVFNVNPIGWLLQVTAGNLFNLMMPF